MTKICNFYVMTMFFFITSIAHAQFSRELAVDLVLNDILVNELGHTDVYASNSSLNLPSSLLLSDQTQLSLPFPENWVFFVDDLPFANWHHPCRYIFVNGVTGEYSLVSSSIFPQEMEDDYELINEVFRPDPIPLPTEPKPMITGLAPNPHLFAVFIVGTEFYRFWRDISAMYNTLIDVYGYSKENIIIHYDDGTSSFPEYGNDLDFDGQGDIDYPAYKESIEETFRNLSGNWNTLDIPELHDDDQLFVFIATHGSLDGNHSYIGLAQSDPTIENLYDTDFAEYLEDIHCAQMVFLFQNCFAGGFISKTLDYTSYNVQCKNRNVHSASRQQNPEPSWAEMHITNLLYDEFVFYWTAAARGWYPGAHPWEVSYETGTFPFNNYPTLINHPIDYSPDINGDGFVQMQEAFAYADDNDTYSPGGYFMPYPFPFPPPDPEIEHPETYSTLGISDNYLSLCGLAGNINTNQSLTLHRSYMVGGNLNIGNSVNLTIDFDTKIHFRNEIANLSIAPGGTLTLNNKVTFTGKEENKVEINGNLTIYPISPSEVGATFSCTKTTGYFDGLYLNNPTLTATLDKAMFIRARLTNNSCPSLALLNSTFSDESLFTSYTGTLDVEQSEFNNSYCHLEDLPANNNLLTIKNSTFQNSGLAGTALDITNFDRYSIEDNTISGYSEGIQLWYTGFGDAGNQTIKQNSIHNNAGPGIIAYNSIATIENNHISNNLMGIKLMNGCNTKVSGNSAAQYASETQEILDNTGPEVYAAARSFPWFFKYNVIQDEDNLGNPIDPIVFYAVQGGPIDQSLLDVRYNCWDNYFNPSIDLYPQNWYLYQPSWCPSGDGGQDQSSDEALYEFGVNQFEANEYSAAENTFQTLVNTYPESQFSSASMKDMYRIRQFTTNDYSELQQYFQSNNSIQSDSSLNHLAEFLSNRCDITLENWPDAVDWLENIIENPPSFEDSIFAIIDIGYVYYLVENSGLKSSFPNNAFQYIPSNKTEYYLNRDYLISLLPHLVDAESDEKKTTVGRETMILSYPNPCNQRSNIRFHLSTEGVVTILLSSITGQQVQKHDEGNLVVGDHSVELFVGSLDSGIYYFNIYLNGDPIYYGKMTIMK
jgi:hypothetical protein